MPSDRPFNIRIVLSMLLAATMLLSLANCGSATKDTVGLDSRPRADSQTAVAQAATAVAHGSNAATVAIAEKTVGAATAEAQQTQSAATAEAQATGSARARSTQEAGHECTQRVRHNVESGDYSDLRPGAKLGGCDLSGLRLFGLDLSGADLDLARLSGADLHNANLTGATLRGAFLDSANLQAANLSNADLAGADLTSADLRDSNLGGAVLKGALVEGNGLGGLPTAYPNLADAVWVLRKGVYSTCPIIVVTWSPDGRRLAFVGYSGSPCDRFARVVDAETGTVLVTRSGDDLVTNLSWCPDSTQLASIGPAATVIVWDADTGDTRKDYPSQIVVDYHLAFSPNGQTLASSIGCTWGEPNFKIVLWDATTGTRLQTLGGGLCPLWSLEWSLDGKQVAAGGAGGAIIWDWGTEAPQTTWLRQSKAAGVVDLAWSPGGERLASAHEDGRVRIWDIDSSTVLATLDDGGGFRSVAWSPKGELLAIGKENAVQIWDVQTAQRLLVLTGHTGAVLDLSWSPDGQRLASGSEDGTVRLWPVTVLLHN